jgi:hypothetical protein
LPWREQGSIMNKFLIKSRLHLFTGLPAKIQISVTAKIKLTFSTVIINDTEEGLTITLEGLCQNTAALVLIRIYLFSKGSTAYFNTSSFNSQFNQIVDPF